tara:strand:- start:2209 stop:2574 length:366 start_codon:yes stop_codon:yes gene_type:complete
MFHHQDFKKVDIGHGCTSVDDKMGRRILARNDRLVSIPKPQFSSSQKVKKSIIESTEAQKTEYCDGKQIIGMRTQKKLSQKELAQKSNVNVRIIQDLEVNKLVATPQNKVLLNKIKRLLQV